MKPFRYGLDPLCLLSCLAYGLNRWIFERFSSAAFFHEHFNDLLLIPAALPLVLWIQRKLGLRQQDSPPTVPEIAGHWLAWSIIAEGIGPHVFARATGDALDVAAYGIGAIAAGIWWNRPRENAGFDLLAAHYDWMEAVLAGKKLARCRNAFLDRLPPVTNALLAGEGHGKFLVELLRRNPDAQITCVDASKKMLEVSRKRLKRESLSFTEQQVKFIPADLLEWQPHAAEYDLIATHFFLDCFTREQLSRLIPRLANAASPNAHWLISDFQIPLSGFARWRARVIHWLMYGFFRVVVNLPAKNLSSPSEFLQQQGFTRIAREEFDWGLLHADLWSAQNAVTLPPIPSSRIRG